MMMLIYPLLLLLPFAPLPGPSAQVLGDFSRFSKALNQEISLVGADGTVREGVLTVADGDQVTLRFGSATQTFPRASIVSAERTRDGRIDGVIKGALFGLLLSSMASQGLESSDDAPGFVARSVLSFAAIGYVVDAGNRNRQPLYRAPAANLKSSLSLSFRF